MRFAYLIKKDWLLTTKNYFFYVTLFMAVLMVIVINYVVPEDVSIKPSTYIVFEYEVPSEMASVYEDAGYKIFDNQSELDLALEDNIQSFGVIFKDETSVEYRLQGHENERYKEFLELSSQFMFGEYTAEVPVVTTNLKDFDQVADVPFNKLLLPLFLVMEPALLGMFLVATMIFSEKEENTITAYATTPSSINAFILSKTVVLIFFSLISLMITTMFVVGFSANYFWLIVLTIVCSLMGSALGLLLASFFDNISSAMMWIIGGSLLLSMPFASYFAPSFVPVWMKFLPTYYMLFAYKEAAFPTGNPEIIYNTIGICLAVGTLCYVLSLIKYKRIFKAL